MISPILPAFLLDLILGDPEKAPHPVKVIGSLIEKLEKLFRKKIKDEFIAGAALFFSTVGLAYFASFMLVNIAFGIHSFVGYLVEIILIYYSLSVKSLSDEAKEIFRLLNIGEIEQGRQRLSRIVGRDTGKMDEEEVSRACVESIAENLVDGVISPLFFAAVGGAPLAIAYKAVNTCDSMVGYRNEKFEMVGKVSAIADDAVNFIPARISIPLISLAAFSIGMDWKNVFHIGLRDRLNHPSPNSAHSEAAFAGALGVRLGGKSFYGGKESIKPHLGDEINPISLATIADATKLMRVTAIFSCFIFVLY